MLRSEKKDFVLSLEDVYKESNSIIITHYHGLTVGQLTNLRKLLKKNESGFRIVKNTLSKIAAKNVGMDNVYDMFSGPTGIAFSKDPVSAAKTVMSFVKNNEKLKIIGGIVNNMVLDAEGVMQLSKLPSLNQLREKRVGIIQRPAINVVTILKEPATQISRVLYAFSNNK